jgi:branched-subunit amino acid transport protein
MDRSLLSLIAAAALLTYATRIAGLSLGDRRLPPVIVRFLSYVPIAAFAALVAPGLGGTDGELVPRLAAAGVASAVVLRTGRLWACLLVGMMTFWLMRSLP